MKVIKEAKEMLYKNVIIKTHIRELKEQLVVVIKR